MKKKLYTELAYVLGHITLAFGTALMERADFGMSMVVAPAYLIYLKLSEYLPWFTFGMAEYCFQAFLLVVLAAVLHGFRRRSLFSFITAFVYGCVLDGMMLLVGQITAGGMAARVVFYVLGLIFCAVGVSLFFHTYITPEAYELFVKELAAKYRWNINKTKTAYDCCSCLLAILMSFLFMGFLHFEGVKAGTILCALVNGWVIGRCSGFLERHFEFPDAFDFRKYFA